MTNKSDLMLDYQAHLADIRGARGAITVGRTSMQNALDIMALETQAADLPPNFKCFLLAKIDAFRERLKVQAKAEVVIEQRYNAMYGSLGKLQAILRRHDLSAKQSGHKRQAPPETHRQAQGHKIHEVALDGRQEGQR